MKTRGSEAGFSLVETLVAFVVVAASAVGVLASISISVRASNEAEMRFLALQYAEELVWAARTGDPDELPSEGSLVRNDLVWTRAIEPLAVSEDVFEIRVDVSWRAGAETKSVQLLQYRRGYEDDEET